MRRFTVLIMAALAGAAGMGTLPASAQRMSPGHEFLQAVRERDGTKATQALQRPGTTVINTRDLSSGESALHIVVQRRDAAWLAFLLGKGANANAVDQRGVTPLLLASSLGWAEGVETLVKKGAAVDATNDTGETPLITAVLRRDLSLVNALLKGGANPDKSDNSGRTARDYGAELGPQSEIMAALEKARAERKARAANSYGPGS